MFECTAAIAAANKEETRGAGPARTSFAATLLAILVGLTAALGLATATLAHAESYINLTQLCKDQYNQPRAEVRQVAGHEDPYSYYCVLPEHASGSAGVSVDKGGPGVSGSVNWGGGGDLGGLDVQGWCNKHMAGLPATAWPGPNQWTCGDGSVEF